MKLRDVVLYPLTMFEDKLSERRVLSMFRVVLAVFTVTFVVHWPDEWTATSVAALMALTLALPLRDLFHRVPVGEVLSALRAYFERRMGP